MNTIKDLTFDNIYHEHYNYWSLTSLVNFSNSLTQKLLNQNVLIRMEGQLEFILKKQKSKGYNSVKDA